MMKRNNYIPTLSQGNWKSNRAAFQLSNEFSQPVSKGHEKKIALPDRSPTGQQPKQPHTHDVKPAKLAFHFHEGVLTQIPWVLPPQEEKDLVLHKNHTIDVSLPYHMAATQRKDGLFPEKMSRPEQRSFTRVASSTKVVNELFPEKLASQKSLFSQRTLSLVRAKNELSSEKLSPIPKDAGTDIQSNGIRVSTAPSSVRQPPCLNIGYLSRSLGQGGAITKKSTVTSTAPKAEKPPVQSWDTYLAAPYPIYATKHKGTTNQTQAASQMKTHNTLPTKPQSSLQIPPKTSILQYQATQPTPILTTSTTPSSTPPSTLSSSPQRTLTLSSTTPTKSSVSVSSSPVPAKEPRPETTDLVARRLIAGALGIKIVKKSDERTLAIAKELRDRRNGNGKRGAD